MLIVGASRTLPPMAFSSRPMAAPTRCSSAGSQVAPRAIPTGKVVAPRAAVTPLGPSLILRGGMSSRSRPGTFQRVPPPGSEIALSPDIWATFSSMVIWATRSFTSCSRLSLSSMLLVFPLLLPSLQPISSREKQIAEERTTARCIGVHLLPFVRSDFS